MKKSITGAVALLAGAFVAHSQGTVSFGNYAFLSTYVYVSLKSGSTTTPLNGSSTVTTGVPATDVVNGNDWTVALYGAPGSGDAASTLVQLDTAGGTPVTANFAGIPAPSAGEWASSEIASVPSTGNGSPATVQLYAWYNDNGKYTTYALALAAGVPTGFSTTGNVTLGAPPGTPASLPTGTGANQIGSFLLSGGTITTPEPSTIALGIMGASAFLLRLRKKQ